MTAPTTHDTRTVILGDEEIKRWEVGPWDTGLREATGPILEGDLVDYADHEAAIIKAKIEVLEEVPWIILSIIAREYITNKIAQLQAQLEAAEPQREGEG